MAVAALMAAAFAVLAIALVAHLDVGRMTYGDGLIYRDVAKHLTSSSTDVEPIFARVGTEIRYGRIGLPFLLFVVSAGQKAAMPYVQPLLMVLAAAAIGAAARCLLPRLGAVSALVPFAAIGLFASMLGGYQEPLAIAFALWAVVFVRQERWVESAVLLACAMLTRENAAVVFFGVLWWSVANRRLKGTAILAAAALPVAAWHAFVWLRFGSLPLLDPHLRGNDEFGPPFVALWRSLHINDPHVVAAIVVHVLLAIVAFALARRGSLFGSVAVIGAFFVVWNGPPEWFNVGDGVRIQVFLETFTILGCAEMFADRRPRTIVLDAAPAEDDAPRRELVQAGG
jgi:hypothetical protein